MKTYIKCNLILNNDLTICYSRQLSNDNSFDEDSDNSKSSHDHNVSISTEHKKINLVSFLIYK